jgi:hypothetical protein
MKQPTLLSFPGFVILLLMSLFGIGLAKKCLHSTTVYICAGFLLMSMYAVRNEMFLIIAYLFLLRDISDLLKNINYDWEKDIKNSLIFVLGISILLLGHVGIQTLDTLFTGNIEDFTDMQTTKKIYDEISGQFIENLKLQVEDQRRTISHLEKEIDDKNNTIKNLQSRISELEMYINSQSVGNALEKYPFPISVAEDGSLRILMTK